MKEVLKCPECESSQTRYRVKTEDRICYSCGNVFKITDNVSDIEEKYA